MAATNRLRSRKAAIAAAMFLVGVTVAIPGSAFAFIMSGEDNDDRSNPAWPSGAAEIFNHPGRVRWLEGPPFGGGLSMAECCGDTEAFQAVLATFAKMDRATKRLVVRDGVGLSSVSRPEQDPPRRQIDWVFTVWDPTWWARLKGDIDPHWPADAPPPAQLEVYTANIRWSEIDIPEGIEVLDQRLEAHGFSPSDGVVIEGRIIDLRTRQPIAAEVQVQRGEQVGTETRYSVVGDARADAEGKWVIKHVPAGHFRVVAMADGYAPRIIGTAWFDELPQWKSFDGELAMELAGVGAILGQVTDESGTPVPRAEVKLHNVQPTAHGRYESPLDHTFYTDAEGRFRADFVPAGKIVVRFRRSGELYREGSPVLLKAGAEAELALKIQAAR